MPSETGKQHRFMAANCTSAKVRKKTGMSKKVACDFMHADKGKKFKESELDSHSRWVLDGGMNTKMESVDKEFTESMKKLAETKIKEAEDPFASWQGMDLQRKHYDRPSDDIIDGAIRITAAAKTAQERVAALQRYADEVGVPFAVLHAEIMQDTGQSYFSKDDYTKGHEFQRPTRESSELMNRYKAIIKHKR